MLIYLQMIEADADKTKFERIYNEYCGLMFHAAFQLLHHQEDAEDAVHSAFVNIAENISRITDPVCPKTKAYVVIIAERRAIDILRKQKRTPTTPLEETAGIEIPYDGENYLAECILKLPALQRQVIWLKYYHGYNLHEIAKMMKISLSWATKLDQRAKKELEKLYDGEVKK